MNAVPVGLADEHGLFGFALIEEAEGGLGFVEPEGMGC
jgi:hypothetical protein